MKLVENINKDELIKISKIVGEAFINNELFHEFGEIECRRPFVMKYMNEYVKCVYELKALYSNEDGTAFIGLSYSDKKKMIPQIKMIFTLLRIIPYKVNKRFLNHIKQISDGNKKYTVNTYLEVLFVCVSKEHQKEGKSKELVNFAKEMARKRRVPLLFDTDMEEYAKIYEHYGCKLYNKKTASNGVVRYNLVWNEF